MPVFIDSSHYCKETTNDNKIGKYLMELLKSQSLRSVPFSPSHPASRNHSCKSQEENSKKSGEDKVHVTILDNFPSHSMPGTEAMIQSNGHDSEPENPMDPHVLSFKVSFKIPV